MHAGDDDVELGEQVGVLVEPAVLQDVDLDPGEDAERRQLLVESRHPLQLRLETFGVETVRDRERRRVVGERKVRVAELGPLAGHLLDRGPTVGPVGVQVEVALERGPDRRAGTGVGRGLGLEARQVLGHLSGQRLVDDPGGAGADAGEVAQAPLGGELAQLVQRAATDGVGRLAERLLLVATGALALEQRRDPFQRLHRVHVPKVPAGLPPVMRRSGRSFSPGMVVGWGK